MDKRQTERLALEGNSVFLKLRLERDMLKEALENIRDCKAHPTRAEAVMRTIARAILETVDHLEAGGHETDSTN